MFWPIQFIHTSYLCMHWAYKIILYLLNVHVLYLYLYIYIFMLQLMNAWRSWFPAFQFGQELFWLHKDCTFFHHLKEQWFYWKRLNKWILSWFLYKWMFFRMSMHGCTIQPRVLKWKKKHFGFLFGEKTWCRLKTEENTCANSTLTSLHTFRFLEPRLCISKCSFLCYKNLA